MARNLTIESLNCRGLGDYRKRKKIFSHFFKRQVDIILLQETHTTPSTAESYKAQWKRLSRNNVSFWNSLSSRSCGVAILFTDQTKVKILEEIKDDSGRVITLKIKCYKNIYQIQCVYAPTVPEMRPLFFQELGNYFFKEGQIISGGDFNMVEEAQDRTGDFFTSAHTRGLSDLTNVKNDYDLVDIWRTKNPSNRSYSWSATDGRDIHSRIDRFYLFASLKKSFIQQHLIPNPWSDHRTVSLLIEVKGNINLRRGPGWFKLNTSLLNEEEYVAMINEFLKHWVTILPTWTSIQRWWVEGKNRIIAITRDFSIQQSRLRKQQRSALTKFLKQESDKLNPDKNYVIHLQEKIAELDDYKNRGTMIRSRVDNIIEGEKPTRYFYAQERIKKSNSTITKLSIPRMKPEDAELDNPFTFDLLSKDEDLLSALEAYYQDLFTKQELDTDLQDTYLNNIENKLPAEVRIMMDAEIRKGEIFRAIQLFEKNKTPGIDGLPAEFYETFWDVLEDFFPKLLNDIYSNGLLPSIQQR